jgi:hypothetical protein
MKEIAQTFLILGGGLGFFFAVPAAIYGWLLRGSGGSDTRYLIYIPFICVSAVVAGLVWRKLQSNTNPNSHSRLPEAGGVDGDAGGSG